jgi:dihydrofolate reductase
VAGRNVIANITLTLDGHTTGPGGPFDMTCIAPHGATDEARDALVDMTSASTVLLGRRNFEGFGSWWPTVADDPAADPRDRLFARWLNAVDKVVFSSTSLQRSWENSHRADLGPVETVRRLRQSDGGDIRVLSSQSLIRQLLTADELDRMEVTVAPEIVGGGDRLFGDVDSVTRWRLTDVRPSASGAVLLGYDRTCGPGAGA